MDKMAKAKKTEKAKKLEELAGSEFSIDPSSTYDRDEFVKKTGDYFDLEEYLSQLSKNPGDTGAIEDLVSLTLKTLTKDKNLQQEYSKKFMENPYLALRWGKELYSESTFSLAKHIEKNRANSLEKLSAEALNQIVSQVELYQTGDAEHDKYIAARKKLKKMQDIQKEGGDPASIVTGGKDSKQYIAEEASKKVNAYIQKCPKIAAQFILEHQDIMAQPLLERAKEEITKELNKKLEETIQCVDSYFKNKEGKLDKKKLIKYIERNYKVVEEQMKKRPQDSFKIWDKNLKAQYIELARALRGFAKPEAEKENDPEKSEFKANCKKLGVRT